MSIVSLQILIFFAAVLLTGLCRTVAQRIQLLDHPGERSNHALPTPVGGGLAIAALFLIACTHYFLAGLLPFNLYMVVLAAGLVAVAGLADDCMQLHVRWRVSLQGVAALWVVGWLGTLPSVDFILFELSSPLLLAVLAVLSLLWLLNLYNFMDGIDGLAASELLFVTVMSLSLVINSQDSLVALLSATLFTAGAGFLVWNWPPAKIFMGDVGSGFIGFCLGLLALISMQQGSLSFWTWVILLGVFVTDATTTLLRRVWRGEVWYEGHSTHAYQHAARTYKSHAKVTITVIAINVCWLAPLAWLSVVRPEWGLVWCLVALAPLLLLAIRFGAGLPRVYSLASATEKN